MFRTFLTFVVLVVFASGCGMKAQTYIMTKERVDIQQGEGNAGYLMGGGQYADPHRKTRKVYVLELTKPIPEKEVRKIQQQVDLEPKTDLTSHIPETPMPEPVSKKSSNKIVIPSFNDDSDTNDAVASLSGPKEAVSYTVVKDDTLQKIAKKFYGSYGPWVKIYEANKDKISNPNFLKPGTVITIPAAE